MFMKCADCNASGDMDLPDANEVSGFLSCGLCGGLVGTIDVSEFSDRIERIVQRKLEMKRTGRIGTRKQSMNQSDAEISREGLAAELAACLLIAPARRELYLRDLEVGGGNRGRDFPCELTGLDKPVEVKQTRYRTATAGYLLVRPPRMTPGRMLTTYIDNSYYVLLHGHGFNFTAMGWADRSRVVSDGKLNPVPCGTNQRECWGIHWSKMLQLSSLAERLVAAA